MAVADIDTVFMVTSMPGRLTAGLGILGLLSVCDLLSFVVFPSPGVGEVGPPPWINALGVALGLVSLALIGFLVRRGRRAVALGLVACRALSALTGVPAFVVAGVPMWIRVFVALFIALTVVGCVLVAPLLRSAPRPAG